MNLRKTAVTGIKWTTIGTIGRAIFQLLQISILAHFLPKEAFGIIAMALFVVQFTNIFVDMGLSSAILHHQNTTQKEYSSIFWLNIFISFILYLLLVITAPAFSHFYAQPELKILIPILGTNLLIMACGRQHRTILQKQFKFKEISIIELISFFIGLVIAVLLVKMNFGIYSLVYSTLISSLVSNAAFLIQNIKKNPIEFYFSINDTKPFLKIGGFSMGSTLLDFFSREIDVLIIGKLLGAESLGIYNLTKQIVVKLFSVINPIVITVFSPLLSSIQKEKERLRATYIKIFKYLAYINFPIYLMVIASSREILQILYGSGYADSFQILTSLAFAYCLVALSNPVGSLQIATGRTDIGFKWTIFRVLITPPIIYLGALKNIETVAIYYAVLSLFMVIPLWFMQLWPMIKLPFKEYLAQFYKPLIFLIIATIGIYIIGDKTTLINVPIINAIIKAFLMFFVFGIYIFIFDKNSIVETINIIKSTFKRNK
jgi:O-antigen/teichoic acid export membrane protein